MLDALRRGATGLVAKILLSMLILSFGIWGIADVFRGYTRGAVATVGSAKITPTDYDRVLRSELDGISQEAGRRVSLEDARKQGIDRLVLSKMIGQTALKEYAQQINLGLSPDRVVQNLLSDPDFAGPDGKFSRTGFNDLLARLGMSESMFLSLRLDDDLRQQFSSAILNATVTPQAMIDIENGYKNETRDISFFKIDPKKVTVAEPDEAKLQAYYNDNKASFMTPEYRKFNVLAVTAADLKKDVQVTDEELKASYESDKETYDTPEKRRVQQIAFKDKATAEAARDALVKGTKNFMDVAKENGAKESDVNLGLISKSQMIDPKIADAAFKIDRDAISEVIEGRFATVILRVIEISPGKVSTFEETKDKVRDKLATSKATTLLQEKIDLIEEGRNAGKTKKQIADELKLRYVEVGAADKDGKAPDGNAVLTDIPTPERVMRLVFRTEPGTLVDPVEIGSDGYAWVEVIGIDPPKEKPFDAVKAEVKTAVIDSETRKLIKDLADKFIERIKSGEEFAKVAADAGGQPDKVETVKRNLVPPGLTEEAIEVAFSLPLNGAGSALTVDRGTRVVVKVDKITPAGELPGSEKDKLVGELRRGLQNDLLIAYVTNLQERLGVSINEKELARITGADVAAN